jgi:hypothetical protein
MADVTIGIDDLTPPQPNGTLIYRMIDKQWFWSPHIAATCWCVWKTKGDALELYRGAYHASVIQEGITDGDNANEGTTGQVTGDAAVPETSIKDEDATWTENEWAGATMFLHRFADDSIEYATVLGNTAGGELVGAPNSFNGTVNDAWTGANPAKDDYYILIRQVRDNASIRIRWKTLKLGLASVRLLKQFIELTFRAYATGTLVLNWKIDGARSGSLTFDLSQGVRYWGKGSVFGIDDGATEPGPTTLLWRALDDMILKQNFNDSAEGSFVEFEIQLDTSNKFDISMLAITYLMHLGNRWG